MSLKQKMAKGIIWTSADRVATQLVQFIIGVFIARIVSPSDYGILAILMIFIGLSQVFIDSGFGKALIQKNNPTIEDCSTVFWFNLGASIILYAFLWYLAPYIAHFFKMPELIKLTRISSLILVINSLIIVPQSLFSLRLEFKPLALSNFISAILSGIVGIVLAVEGFGVWALVGQTISRGIFSAIILEYQLHWIPLFTFSKRSFKELFFFGKNLLASSFLGSFVNETSSFVIGKIFKPEQLGFYSRGTHFAGLPYTTITSIVYRVLFPSLASVKSDHDQLVKITKDTIRYISFISFPVLLWMAMVAEPMVRVLLTEKWIPAVPIIQIICLARMITIIAGISVELLNAVGRSDLSLRQDFLKIGIRLGLLVAAMKYGIVWIAIAELTATVLHFFINTYYPGKMLKYGAISQIKDFSPILLAAISSTSLGFVIMLYINNDFLKILVALFSASIIYALLLYLLNQRDLFKLFKMALLRIKGDTKLN